MGVKSPSGKSDKSISLRASLVSTSNATQGPLYSSPKYTRKMATGTFMNVALRYNIASSRGSKSVSTRRSTAVRSVRCTAEKKTGPIGLSPLPKSTRSMKMNTAPGAKFLERMNKHGRSVTPLNAGSGAISKEEKDTTVEDLGLLLLRIVVGSLMIHHGIDKVGNAEGFTKFVTAKYFGFLPNPLACTFRFLATGLEGFPLAVVKDHAYA